MKRAADRNKPLADHTTLGVGGPATRLVRAATAADLIGLVAAADTEGTPVLMLGGGSNMLVSDAGFDGLVIKTVGHEGCPTVGSCWITAPAPTGTNW